MATNVFLGNSPDPLLGNSAVTPIDYDRQIAELQQMQQRLEGQRQQQRAQILTAPQQAQAPIWEEIEKLTSEMSDREFEFVNKDEDFQNSQQSIMAILQREQMRMMRPIVEGTTDGRAALENHLALLKQLRKKAAREADRNMDLFNEYTQHYSDMTYSDFLKLKKSSAEAEQTSKK